MRLELMGGRLQASEVQVIAEFVWRELQQDESAREIARNRGVVFDDVIFGLDAPFTVKQGSAGIDPLTTTIVISFATSLAASTVVELFKAYVIPRIREMRGDDSVGDGDLKHD